MLSVNAGGVCAYCDVSAKKTMFGRCRERRTAESANRAMIVQRFHRADSNGAIVVSTADGGVIIPFHGGMGAGA